MINGHNTPQSDFQACPTSQVFSQRARRTAGCRLSRCECNTILCAAKQRAPSRVAPMQPLSRP